MINLALNIAAFLFLAWVAVMVLAGIVFIVISPFVAISEAMHQGKIMRKERNEGKSPLLRECPEWIGFVFLLAYIIVGIILS